MLRDYYKTLYKRTVTMIPDGGGGFSESVTDTEIKGYITVMNNFEKVQSAQLGVNASARLFTEEVLELEQKIVDGSEVYEIVGKYNQHHLFYDIKIVDS